MSQSWRRHTINLSRNVEALIHERDLSWCAVARAAGVDTRVIYRLRDEPHRYNVMLGTASKIADALNIPLGELIEDPQDYG